MKTFQEWLALREAAPTSPTAPGTTPISPDLQQAAKNVMNKMGPALMPTDPNITMADWLKKKPGLMQTFTKNLMADPAARKAGLTNINMDTAQQLMMGDPNKPVT